MPTYEYQATGVIEIRTSTSCTPDRTELSGDFVSYARSESGVRRDMFAAIWRKHGYKESEIPSYYFEKIDEEPCEEE